MKCKVKFRDSDHLDFYLDCLPKCRYQDPYHSALVYCLGIDRGTREHIDRIYDFKTGYVRTECLHEGWQTSGSMRITRMAFNLYNNGMPSVSDVMTKDEMYEESERYTPADLFCCEYAEYFWQAVRIRYPEYYRET